MRLIFPIIAVLGLSQPTLAQDLRLFSVGTAGLYGGYYAATRAICDVINQAERRRLRCSPEPTPGSVYNLVNLDKGQLDLALVQSDWQKHALQGTSLFADRGPMSRLRSVMALYSEPFNLIARRDANIAGIRDLVGKRIDIGQPSSGRQATMNAVMEVFGIERSDFRFVTELPGTDSIDELCKGQVDATALIIGHPSSMIARALNQCNAELVPLVGPEIDRLISGGGGYGGFSVPSNTYASLSSAVASFAVRATVVTLSTVDDDVVEAFVGHTLANLDVLKQKVPFLAELDPTLMRSSELSAPLHPAAMRAFENRK